MADLIKPMFPWCAAALLLSACAANQPIAGTSSPDQKSAIESSNALQLADMAIPPNTKFDAENSLIIGSGDRWLGRVVLKTDGPAVQIYNYFYNGMPAFGWSLVTAIQAKTSTLTYLRGERVATIQIEPGSLSGAQVSITVSTRAVPATDGARAKKVN